MIRQRMVAERAMKLVVKIGLCSIFL